MGWDYAQWKQEREQTDLARVARHRDAQGDWRRPWDMDKAKPTWVAGLGGSPAAMHVGLGSGWRYPPQDGQGLPLVPPGQALGLGFCADPESPKSRTALRAGAGLGEGGGVSRTCSLTPSSAHAGSRMMAVGPGKRARPGQAAEGVSQCPSFPSF